MPLPPHDLPRLRTPHSISLPAPATEWEHALPLGNGRLGAMVFGGVARERIALNEESIWAGWPGRCGDNPDAARHLPRVRALISQGEVDAALELAEEHLRAVPPRLMPYQTLGDLILEFQGQDWHDYYTRELGLDEATVRIWYTDTHREVLYEREAFVSAPDQVMVLRLTAPPGHHLNLQARLARAEKATLAVSGDRLVLHGDLAEGRGIVFDAALAVRVSGDGARVTASADALCMQDATTVELFVAAGTNATGHSCPDPHVTLDAALKHDYATLRQRHVDDYRKYFNRCSLNLEDPTASLRFPPHTPQRLAAVTRGESDPGLANLYFDFARYLLISSSRPGTLPANLQGIWADGLNPAWNCDFHTNINLQMNYWPAEVANLADCHEPLLDFVESLVAPGRATARAHYDCGGFVIHHNTTIWRETAPHDSARCGLWPMGAAWLMLHFWEHYAFSADRTFLARAWPTLAEACTFLLDFMVEDEAGRLVTNPSHSPENSYAMPDGRVGFLCIGATMDRQIIRANLRNLLAAAELLGCADDPVVTRAREALPRIPDDAIGPDGRLLEWLEPYDEPEPGHRHISHVFALYPDHAITPARTPELAAAVRKSIAHRLRHGGAHTGWSRAWLVSVMARLRDGNAAGDQFQQLLARSTLPNLFDTHPPLQLDGNFGGAAGIAEMLLQSHEGVVDLLPALPDAWPEGSFRGFRARGGLTVDASWRDHRLTEVRVTGTAGQEVTVRLPHEPPPGVPCTQILDTKGQWTLTWVDAS